MTEDAKTSWVVKVSFPDKEPFWFGNFYAEGRADAKVEARRFVSRHFNDDVKIVCISRGSISISTSGDIVPM